MNYLFKFPCSTTQAHSIFCSHFHNINGEERERKVKIRGEKFFRASMLFLLLCFCTSNRNFYAILALYTFKTCEILSRRERGDFVKLLYITKLTNTLTTINWSLKRDVQTFPIKIYF